MGQLARTLITDQSRAPQWLPAPADMPHASSPSLSLLLVPRWIIQTSPHAFMGCSTQAALLWVPPLMHIPHWNPTLRRPPPGQAPQCTQGAPLGEVLRRPSSAHA